MYEVAKMYQIFDGEVIEVVKHGNELVRIDDPKVQQIVGQLVLELEYV